MVDVLSGKCEGLCELCCDGDLEVVFVNVVCVVESIYYVFYFVYNIMELMNFFVDVIGEVVNVFGLL